MFSYLDTVHELVSEQIYARGIKYYLEGKITKQEDLILDFWRLYSTVEEGIWVQIPILHLALDQSKYPKSSEALQQVVSCQCAYFQEFGICKHVVAVCASLEQEFKLSKNQIENTKKVDQKTTESILDNLFDVDIQKKHRRWITRLESYLNTSGYEKPSWFDEVILEVSKDSGSHFKFLESLKIMVDAGLSTWEIELRIITLIKESLYFGGKVWWEFWYPFFERLESHNKYKLWIALWKMYIVGIFKDYQDQFLHAIVNDLDPQLKLEVLEGLEKEFSEKPKVWIDFAIASKNTDWLTKNLDQLEPLILLQIYNSLPDYQDEIEQRIYNQIKIWVEFLPVGEYDELIKTIKTWLKVVGRSDRYEMLCRYIKEIHGKKKKLMEAINN